MKQDGKCEEDGSGDNDDHAIVVPECFLIYCDGGQITVLGATHPPSQDPSDWEPFVFLGESFFEWLGCPPADDADRI